MSLRSGLAFLLALVVGPITSVFIGSAWLKEINEGRSRPEVFFAPLGSWVLLMSALTTAPFVLRYQGWTSWPISIGIAIVTILVVPFYVGTRGPIPPDGVGTSDGDGDSPVPGPLVKNVTAGLILVGTPFATGAFLLVFRFLGEFYPKVGLVLGVATIALAVRTMSRAAALVAPFQRPHAARLFAARLLLSAGVLPYHSLLRWSVGPFNIFWLATIGIAPILLFRRRGVEPVDASLASRPPDPVAASTSGAKSLKSDEFDTAD